MHVHAYPLLHARQPGQLARPHTNTGCLSVTMLSHANGMMELFMDHKTRTIVAYNYEIVIIILFYKKF